MASYTGQAIVIKQNGGPEVLEHVKEFVFPPAGDGEVLIHTVSTSVNPVDTYIRNGLFGKLTESQLVLGKLFLIPQVFCSCFFLLEYILSR